MTTTTNHSLGLSQLRILPLRTPTIAIKLGNNYLKIYLA